MVDRSLKGYLMSTKHFYRFVHPLWGYGDSQPRGAYQLLGQWPLHMFSVKEQGKQCLSRGPST